MEGKKWNVFKIHEQLVSHPQKHVDQARFTLIIVMDRQFLPIPASNTTSERVFSFSGLTLSLYLMVRYGR